MEAQDPLNELADIHLPQEVSFWPPAIGWWIAALLLAAVLVFGGRMLILAMLRRRRKSAALRELDASLQSYQEKSLSAGTRNQAGLDFLNEVNNVLRRVALVHYPRSDVAGLSGTQWLDFLDSCDKGSIFIAGPGEPLGEGAYRQTFDADAEAVYAAARQWIENRYKEEPLLRRDRRRQGEAVHD